jgi:para-nitrobenzyl esterase
MEEVLAMWGGFPEPSMAEDCLVLNVWAPAEAREPLPVLVFLHGGGHGIGSGSWPAYDGSRLAAHSDVVVVTLNHRLGLLGYLYLAELGGDRFATSGINGILDIVEALRWLQGNIAEVGGDPQRVLVYGQSGGGAKVATLLAMPSSYGLYHAAGIMSAPVGSLQSTDEATDMAGRVLSNLGIKDTDIDALFDVPAERLVEAHNAVGNALSSFRPVRDGSWAIDDPLAVVSDGRAPDVPLLIGTTRDEFATMSPAVLVPSHPDDEWVREQVRPFLGDNTEAIVAAYRANRPTHSPRALQVAIATDALFWIGSVRFAEARAGIGGAPVWMYRFDWETPAQGYTGMAPHGSDIPFFFDNAHLAKVTEMGPGREQIAVETSSALVSLAGTGSPNRGGAPEWPPYDAVKRSTMCFGIPSKVVEDPAGDARMVFEHNPAAELDRALG